jgi:hypothetical protein
MNLCGRGQRSPQGPGPVRGKAGLGLPFWGICPTPCPLGGIELLASGSFPTVRTPPRHVEGAAMAIDTCCELHRGALARTR